MPLSNADNPVVAEEPAVEPPATKKSPKAKAEAAKEAPEPVVPKLGRAAESGDAGVQNLLAERHTHASNADDEKVADVDRRLAEFGYAA